MTTDNDGDKENRRFQIMIVEDEQASLEMLTMILETNENIKCIPFSSPKEALAYFKQGRVDCTLLDIGLPDMCGIDLLKQIKTINPDAKVVMQTANKDRATVKRAVDSGANFYIVKPYDPEKILAVMDKIMQ